jgi:hypothetical protein
MCPDGAPVSSGIDPCTDEGPTKGCEVSKDCSDADLCLKPDQACDEPGECTKKPDTCVPEQLSAPICGCDGQTYESVCHAQLEGVSLADKKACK